MTRSQLEARSGNEMGRAQPGEAVPDVKATTAGRWTDIELNEQS